MGVVPKPSRSYDDSGTCEAPALHGDDDFGDDGETYEALARSPFVAIPVADFRL
jgi:hypothetical protein